MTGGRVGSSSYTEIRLFCNRFGRFSPKSNQRSHPFIGVNWGHLKRTRPLPFILSFIYISVENHVIRFLPVLTSNRTFDVVDEMELKNGKGLYVYKYWTRRVCLMRHKGGRPNTKKKEKCMMSVGLPFRSS